MTRAPHRPFVLASLPICVAAAVLDGCGAPGDASRDAAAGLTTDDALLADFDRLVDFVEAHADAIVFEGDGGSRVLVSPRLQGRVLTAKVGAVASTGFVDPAAIRRGDVDPRFNNFGGIDRFWIGPEAGQFGVYFRPGSELDRESWRVPRDFDTGPFELVERSERRVRMQRAMRVMNYLGSRFQVDVEREIGLLTVADLPAELGIELPAGVDYCGVYSRNRLENAGPAPWSPQTGLIGIWILGMFAASEESIVIAPLRDGPVDSLGPYFRDDYFDDVSEESPDRIRRVDGAVIFRGDARRIGKFGLGQSRTTGIAGSYDFTTDLLTVVQFDVPSEPKRYGNSVWQKDQSDPYAGDAFQSYNNGVADSPEALAEARFYELESASPVEPLAPGAVIVHRHATHHFQGPREALADLTRRLLGVDLQAARAAILPGTWRGDAARSRRSSEPE